MGWSGVLAQLFWCWWELWAISEHLQFQLINPWIIQTRQLFWWWLCRVRAGPTRKCMLLLISRHAPNYLWQSGLINLTSKLNQIFHVFMCQVFLNEGQAQARREIWPYMFTNNSISLRKVCARTFSLALRKYMIFQTVCLRQNLTI